MLNMDSLVLCRRCPDIEAPKRCRTYRITGISDLPTMACGLQTGARSKVDHTMPLTPSQQRCIFSFTTTLLQDALHDAHLAGEVMNGTRAFQASVREVIDAFSYTWNRTKSVTAQLPVEVLLACFEWLEPQDRLTVTHVSRDWRAIAIAEPTLWTALVPTDPYHASADYFETLLRRSHSLPFDIECPVPAIYPLQHTGRENLHRIRTLVLFDIDKDTWELFRDAAGVMVSLRHLTLTRDSRVYDDAISELEHFRVPPAWVPNLHSMKGSGFELPTGPDSSPFLSLRHFSGTLCWEADLTDMFTFMPRLETLLLEDVVTSDSEANVTFPTGPLPSNLRSVSLRTENGEAKDFGNLIDGWAESSGRLELLEVDLSSTLEPFLRLFIASRPRDEPWTMTLARTSPATCVSLKAESDIMYTVLLPDCRQYYNDILTPNIAYCSRLSHLHIFGIRGFIGLFESDLTLPSLTTLTVDIGPYVSGDFSFWDVAELGRLTVPILSCLRFDCHLPVNCWRGWFTTQLPRIIDPYIVLDCPRLPKLVISGPDMSHVPPSVSTALQPLAVEFILEERPEDSEDSEDSEDADGKNGLDSERLGEAHEDGLVD
ncbi:hypothetical protein EXIGLDRAFT_844269 [Exidia glandulosa HHB12029]|uniref:F-box domain-containing protein n=1 Tax=Exidia glandulosa HHB12029 TaxID=1314781 RepID=A0A165C596_EXIGL|nr:hypothetical protein EXIGLDRAFT_844269 [Exidia glandulosa HHB12029]